MSIVEFDPPFREELHFHSVKPTIHVEHHEIVVSGSTDMHYPFLVSVPPLCIFVLQKNKHKLTFTGNV